MRIFSIHFFYPFEVHFNTHKMQSTKFAQTTLRYLFGSKAFQLWSFSHFTPTYNKCRTSPQYILHQMSTCISIFLVQDEEAVCPHLYSPNTHQSTSLLVLVISSIDRSYCKSTRLRMSDCVQKIGHWLVSCPNSRPLPSSSNSSRKRILSRASDPLIQGGRLEIFFPKWDEDVIVHWWVLLKVPTHKIRVDPNRVNAILKRI